MCPACLASLAITVATTTGATAAVSAWVIRAKRSFSMGPRLELEEEDHDPADTDGEDRSRIRPSG